VLHRGARARSRLADDEAFPRQGFERDAVAAGERMVGGGDDHERVAREGFRRSVELARRPAHDHQVELVRTEELHDLLAVGDGELDRHFRVGRRECRKQCRGEILRRAHRAQLQHAALQSPHGGERLAGFPQQLRDLSRVAQELHAGGREADLAPELLEERHADFLLEEADLLRDGGLRQMQLLRRAGEGEMPRHGREHPHLSERYVTHS